jgi:RNA-binding protein YlmH
MLKTYKASAETEAIPLDKESVIGCGNEDIELSYHIAAGIDQIEIVLEEVTGEWRLDKLLGDKISDTSRSVICNMIETGAIRVDGKIVKQSLRVKQHQVITILPAV